MLGLTGQPFWQDESNDRLVHSQTEFDRIVRMRFKLRRHYIEWNPVTAGLCVAPEAFTWSSARPIGNRPQVNNLPHF